MASKSLGTLTLDLIAKVGGFIEGMDRAERSSAKFRKEVERNAKAVVTAGAAFAAAFLTKFIYETQAAEKEQAQLSAVLRSTGEAAGYSRDQLNAMADAMEAASTISAGEITEAQTALLAFTGIVGDEFPRALQAAVDMASRTGTSVVSAAETIGRALDVPSKGLTALSKQGFRFTDDQKKVALALEESGRAAEAQAIILKALEDSYGGAAQASRDTFGGALTAVKNSFDALMSGGDGTLNGATDALNKFNDTLRDPTVKAAVDSLAGAFFTMGDAIAKVVVGGVEVTKFLAEELAAFVHGVADDDISRLEQQLEKWNAMLKNSSLRFQGAYGSRIEVFSVSEVEKSISEIEKKIAEARARISSDAKKDQSALVVDTPRALSEAEQSEILRQKELQKELEKTAEARRKHYETMQRQVEAIELERQLLGMTSDQQRLYRLETEGATQAQLAQAQASLEVIAVFEQQQELQRDFLQLQKELMSDEEKYRVLAGERYVLLAEAAKAGLISEAEYARLLGATTEELQRQLEAIEEKTAEFDEFTKNAARSIQGELSNALVAGFDGGSQDLLKRWGGLLKRMIADAVAADLMRGIFGQQGGDGQYGTGQALAGLGNLFAGFFDGGGNIPAGQFGIVGERGAEIVRGPADITGRLETKKVLQGSGGVTIGSMNFPGVTNEREARRAAGSAGREILQIISASQRYV